jgi:hypothetical protein
METNMAKGQAAEVEGEGADDLGYDPSTAPDSEATQGLQEEDGEGYSFNLKDTKATTGFPVYPGGTYDAVAEDCQFKHSQSSGNAMWEIVWNIEVEGKVKKPRSYVVWTPEQLGRAKMFLKRVAPELQDVEKFDPKEHASHIVGKRARLKINIKPNRDGEDQNNVADVLAPAGGGGDGFNL